MTPAFEIIAITVIVIAVTIIGFYLLYLGILQIEKYRKLKRRAQLLEDLQLLQYLEWSDDLSNNDSCTVCLETFPRKADICVFRCEHACHVSCLEEIINRCVLRCLQCQSEIVPNSRNYTDVDIQPSPEKILHRNGEQVPICRPTLFQDLKFRIRNRQRYLRVPSDFEEEDFQPGCSRPYTQSPPMLVDPGQIHKKSGGRTLSTNRERHQSAFVVNADDTENGSPEVSSSMLEKFSLSPDSVFCTPGSMSRDEVGELTVSESQTIQQQRSARLARSSDLSHYFHQAEVKVDIHNLPHTSTTKIGSTFSLDI